MLIYILRRVLYSIPVLLVASFLTFWVVRTTYDPLLKYRQSRNAAVLIPQKRHQLGLDQSIFVQWWRWLKGFLHGDLGMSSRTERSRVEHAAARDVADVAAHVLRHDLRVDHRDRHRCVLGGEAVLGRRLHLHGPVVRRDRDAAVRASGSWRLRCS